ncbi:hypothetical protein [Streptomyces sp. NPDC008150]|uniref:hypothetical protein n=1 Tax=Streptomyces sp. NPDC008150 TaxID=3364816 RepID=UPI0036E773F4
MPDHTPADELRAAADRLRNLATAATPGPWTQTGIGDYGWTVSSSTSALVDTVDSEEGRADADYIATMHPGVGLALADWLDTAAANAAVLTWPNEFVERALVTARQFLRSRPDPS